MSHRRNRSYKKDLNYFSLVLFFCAYVFEKKDICEEFTRFITNLHASTDPDILSLDLCALRKSHEGIVDDGVKFGSVGHLKLVEK